MSKIYAYCRISRSSQSIERQIRNAMAAYPNAIIRQEVYTGTKSTRPEWQRLLKDVQRGDTIVFDSVSRMSRNADDGVRTYFDLYNSGVSLIFLKEPHINTAFYDESLRELSETCAVNINSGDGAIDKLVTDIMTALKEFQAEQLRKQIRIAFNQAQKEVDDIHQRTSEGIETARRNGKQIGGVKGRKLTTKKSVEAKAKILRYSRDFVGGTYDDDATRHKAGISTNTYYKYKRELKEEHPELVVRP